MCEKGVEMPYDNTNRALYMMNKHFPFTNIAYPMNRNIQEYNCTTRTSEGEDDLVSSKVQVYCWHLV